MMTTDALYAFIAVINLQAYAQVSGVHPASLFNLHSAMLNLVSSQ